MFENLIEILKANPRKIVYTEGSDARILESAARLKKDGFLTPILVGNVEEVKAAAAKGNFDIDGLEIIDPAPMRRWTRWSPPWLSSARARCPPRIAAQTS